MSKRPSLPSVRDSLCRVCAVALPALLVLSCAINPVSKLPELVFMSEEKELKIGAMMSEIVRQQWHLSENEELVTYIKDIGENLASVAPRQNIEYSFDVVVDPSYNAFALPGGHLFVHTGALMWFNTEDEMAAVLGHEVIHAAARHTVQRDVASKLAGVGALATTVAGGILAGQAGAMGGQMLSGLAAAGLVSNYSRDQESEADVLGQIMMDKIGYDPFAAAESHRQILRHTRELFGTEPDDAGWLSSHPGSRERITTLEASAAELTASRDVVPRRRDAYLDKINGMLIGQPPEFGQFVFPLGHTRDEYEDEKTMFLHYDLDIQLTFPTGWQTANRPTQVAATNGGMMIGLEFFSDEPKKLKNASAEFLAKWNRKREEAKEKKEPVPPELRVVRRGFTKLRKKRRSPYLKVTMGELPNQGTVMIFFIAAGKNVYELSCFSPTQLFDGYLEDCRNTAKTLRRLTRRNRARIFTRSLSIVEALPNERLSDLSTRAGNAWELDYTASVNGLDRTSDRLAEGQRIKVAVDEPYTGQPEPPEDEEAEEPPSDPKT